MATPWPRRDSDGAAGTCTFSTTPAVSSWTSPLHPLAGFSGTPAPRLAEFAYTKTLSVTPMRFATTLVVIAFTAPLRAQAPLDTAATLDSVVRTVVRLGAKHHDSIWPGYRPDTIPISFVLPSHGRFLFN